MQQVSLIFRFRLVMGAFIVALILSGAATFPVLTELRALNQLINPSQISPSADSNELAFGIDHIYRGLEAAYHQSPWIAYGTDWLGFAHIVIAIFFVGALIDPVASRWTIISGIIACILVIPLALICGSIRAVPVYWRLLDCSLGAFGILPLLYCLKLRKEINRQQ